MASQGHAAHGSHSRCGALSSWHSTFLVIPNVPRQGWKVKSLPVLPSLPVPLSMYCVYMPCTLLTVALSVFPPDPLEVTARRAFRVVGTTEAWGQNHGLPHSPPGFLTPISLVMGPARPRFSLMCPPSFDQLYLQAQSPEGESDWMSLVNEHVTLKQEATFGQLGAVQCLFRFLWKGTWEGRQ